MARRIAAALAMVSLSVLSACAGKTTEQPGSSGAADASVDSGTVLTTTFVSPRGLASDGTTLFIAGDSGEIVAMPVEGGALTTVLNGGATRLNGVDEADVYFQADNELHRVPKAGGAPALLSEGRVLAVALRGGRTYWIEVIAAQPPRLRVVSSGTPPTTLAGTVGYASSMTVTTSTVFMARDGSRLDLLPATGVPDGGVPSSREIRDCAALFSNESRAFCAGGTSINAIANDGSPSPLVNTGTIGGEAANSAYVYWKEYDPFGKPVGSLHRIRDSATDAEVIVNEPVTVFAVDESAVYYSSLAGAIRRIAK